VPSKHYDIHSSFIADLTYGEHAENDVQEFLMMMAEGHVEVKSDRYRNGRMFVETEHNPRNIRDESGERIWQLSGINVTHATWWVYTTSPGCSFVIPVQRLKNYLRHNRHRMTKRDAGRPDNYARGYLLSPQDVLDLMLNEKYDIVQD
jgi:hypothetical protein